MRPNGKRSRRGVIRIEYVIAAVICFGLLGGMTVVLIQYSQRLEAAAARRPVAMRPSGAESPSRTQQTTVRQEPLRQEPTRAEVRPADTARQVNTTTRRPSVVVTEVGEDRPTATTLNPKPAGGSVAYPSGEARVLSSTGRTRIEAENYDLGGEGVAYHDTTAENSGGTYRPHERVDISLSQDSQGDHSLSYTRAGEWLNYSISVPKSGAYRLQIRSAGLPGSGRMRMSFDGVVKSEINLPAAGSNTKYETYDCGVVQLAAGEQVMRVEMTTGEMNINWYEFTPTADSVSTQVRVQPIEVSPVQTTTVRPSTPTVIVSSPGGLLAQENFDDFKAGTRPGSEQWGWSNTGSVSVQQTPGGDDRCLRLVDISRTNDCWVRQSFAEQKETLTWYVRTRFNATATEFGFSLLEDSKQAVFIYTVDAEIGYEDDAGKWRALTKYEPNTWYDLKVEANVKDKTFRVFVDNIQAGGAKLKFRNAVGKINAWVAGTSPQLAGTMYIDSVKVEGP